MLSLFRRNLFFNLIVLLLFAVALHGYYLLTPSSSTSIWNSPTQASIFSFVDTSKYIKIIFSIILIVVQAYLVNDLVIKHKLSRALSTIPAAVFVLYACWVLESDIFQPVLIANLFCILSLWNLFKIYKRHLPIVNIFNSGMYMTIAAVFYPPYIAYVIVLLLGLFSLRNLNLREIAQVICGVLLPYFLVCVYLFYTDQLTTQVLSFFNRVSFSGIFQNFNFLSLLKPIITILLIVFLILIHHGIKKKKKFDAIKKIELSYWMFFISLLSLFMIDPIKESHLMLLSLPISITIGLVLEHKDNSLIKEFCFLLAIGAYAAFVLGII